MRLAVVDTSVFGYEALSKVYPSIPSYEKKIYCSEFFYRVYRCLLEVNPDGVIFAVDSPKGYWRHTFFHYSVRKKVRFAVGEDGRVWVEYWGNIYFSVSGSGDSYVRQRAYKEDLEYAPKDWFSYRQFKKYMRSQPDFVREHLWASYKVLMPSYKGNRNRVAWALTTPKEEIKEFTRELAYKMSKTFGGMYVCVDKAEADDIASVVVQTVKPTTEVVLITVDRDWDQLLAPNVVRFSPMEMQYMDKVSPKEVLWYKILSGDPGDGIPSCVTATGKRIGTINAKKLWAYYGGDMEKVIQEAREEGWAADIFRNRALIDLSFMPKKLFKNIRDAMRVRPGKPLWDWETYGVPLEEIEVMRIKANYERVKTLPS